MKSVNWFKITSFFCVAFALAFSIAGAVEALTVLPEVHDYVTDTAAMLTEGERQKIAGLLARYDQETGNQFVVVTIPSLVKEDLEGYTMRLAEKVRPGRKDKDNGALLVVVREDRKIRIDTGYGLEDRLTDGRCNSIIRNGIAPPFKTGDYASGIRAGVAGMIHLVSPDFQLDGEFVPPPINDRRGLSTLAVIVFFILVIVLQGVSPNTRRRRWYRGGYSGGVGPIFYGGGDYGSGSRGSSRGSGRSSFSGGGGGFGGGGASGGW